MIRAAAVVLAVAACDLRPRPALDPGEHRFRAGDVELVYHVAGQGPVCAVQPGGPGMAWDYLRMPELERELTLVYLEPPGTGGSGELADPDGYTRSAYAAGVEALRVALGRDRLCLLGHSYGGYVAMQYAIEHPAQVERLILYSTTAVQGADWERDADAAVAARAGEPWYPAALEARSAVIDPVPGDCPKLKRIAPFYFADWTHREAELAPFVARWRCWPSSRTGKPKPPEDLRPELAAIRAPVLVVSGAHDFLFPPKYAQLTADAIAGAAQVVMASSGHFAHVEEPAAFARAISTFVRQP